MYLLIDIIYREFKDNSSRLFPGFLLGLVSCINLHVHSSEAKKKSNLNTFLDFKAKELPKFIKCIFYFTRYLQFPLVL
jgi:hypothetical protein